MTRAPRLLARRSLPTSTRSRRWVASSLIGLLAGATLLGACGGDDDDDSSSTTTEPATETTTTFPLQPETTATTTTIAAPPSSVAYVTEGASVMVVNASRIDGAAGRMSDRLAAVGFTMVEPGNYSLGDLEVTQILYDPANPAALAVAQSLQGAFGGGGIQVVEIGAPPPVESGDLLGAGVLVAMGNDVADKSLEELQGLAPATTAATESTTGSTTESTTGSTTA